VTRDETSVSDVADVYEAFTEYTTFDDAASLVVQAIVSVVVPAAIDVTEEMTGAVGSAIVNTQAVGSAMPAK
jgi:hypothetical protein